MKKNLKTYLLVLAAYMGLTFVLTWPVAGQLGTHIPGSDGDAWVHLWTFNWVKEALLSGSSLDDLVTLDDVARDGLATARDFLADTERTLTAAPATIDFNDLDPDNDITLNSARFFDTGVDFRNPNRLPVFSGKDLDLPCVTRTRSLDVGHQMSDGPCHDARAHRLVVIAREVVQPRRGYVVEGEDLEHRRVACHTPAGQPRVRSNSRMKSTRAATPASGMAL